ncbi:MAG: hypothetical protein ABL921_01765 [Pirellula sp.]
MGFVFPEHFSNKAFPAISQGSIPNAFGDAKSQPRPAKIIGARMNHQHIVGRYDSVFENAIEVFLVH